MYSKNHFVENKNHLINKLNLTDAQKDEIKAFFLKHPNYESKIDWNNKNLTYDDFKPLLALDGKSRTQAKARGIEGLVEGRDYVYFGEIEVKEIKDSYAYDIWDLYIKKNDLIGTYKVYQPLSYLGSKILASNKVPPVKEAGAQWCISYQKTPKYWYQYATKGIKFLFLFGNNTKYAYVLYPEEYSTGREVYTFYDKNLGDISVFKNNEKLEEYVHNLQEIPDPPVEEILQGYEEYLEKDAQGFVNLKKDRPGYFEDLSAFVNNGKFICQFGDWSESFDCRDLGLTSLKGSPARVEGAFYCADNKLTSLEGAPRYVSNFFCENNLLTNLVGAPESVPGNFNCNGNPLKNLKGAPSTIGGIFSCTGCGLTTLEGAPSRVEDDFRGSDNALTTLEGAPKYVGGTFYCTGNYDLVSLEGAPEYIGENFDLRDCRMKSLAGPTKFAGGVIRVNTVNFLTSIDSSLEEVGGEFDCSRWRIDSLKGAPKKVHGSFWCNKRIKDLEGAPEYVGGNFYCRENPYLESLKGAPKRVEGNFDCGFTSIESLEGAPEYVGRTFDCIGCSKLKNLQGLSKALGEGVKVSFESDDSELYPREKIPSKYFEGDWSKSEQKQL